MGTFKTNATSCMVIEFAPINFLGWVGVCVYVCEDCFAWLVLTCHKTQAKVNAALIINALLYHQVIVFVIPGIMFREATHFYDCLIDPYFL